MNGQALRTRADVSRHWRVRQWPNDPTVAHLIFTDHLTTLTEATFEAGVEHARRRGARAVRTSAMFPKAADLAISSGFEPIDRLALLKLVTTSHTVAELPALQRSTQPLRFWHHERAARIDLESFGALWGNDAQSLAEIRTATPIHRSRVVKVGRNIAGFAMSGAAGNNGYLQRLATSPEYRRAGVARDLVIDSIRWVAECGVDSIMVNTGLTNNAALSLYESLGFSRLHEQLTIAELRLS